MVISNPRREMKFQVNTNKGYWIWVAGFFLGTLIACLFPNKFPYWEFNIFWLGGHTGFWVKRHYKNKLEAQNGNYITTEEDR